jgi:hypothetical protein
VRVAAPICLEATRNPRLIEKARELRALCEITDRATAEAARVRTHHVDVAAAVGETDAADVDTAAAAARIADEAIAANPHWWDRRAT